MNAKLLVFVVLCALTATSLSLQHPLTTKKGALALANGGDINIDEQDGGSGDPVVKEVVTRVVLEQDDTEQESVGGDTDGEDDDTQDGSGSGTEDCGGSGEGGSGCSSGDVEPTSHAKTTTPSIVVVTEYVDVDDGTTDAPESSSTKSSAAAVVKTSASTTKGPKKPMKPEETNVELHKTDEPTGGVPVDPITGAPSRSDADAGILSSGVNFTVAIIVGVVVGAILSILIIVFLVYRLRKKDEGSYSLDEQSSAMLRADTDSPPPKGKQQQQQEYFVNNPSC